MRSLLASAVAVLAAAAAGTFPICNSSLDWQTRAEDLAGRMTSAEAISWLGNTAPPIARLGLPAYQYWSEALHGVAFSPGVSFASPPSTPPGIQAATSFPEPIGMAAAFDRELIRMVASQVSTEARAMNNAGQAGLDFWTPNVNLFRDPRWGRGQETPGEDPYMASEYVFQLISGLQGGEDPRYLKVVADCKHFAAYDLENWGGVERYAFDAIVSDQDMVESFLPSFESCVRDARVASVMCSYNSVNGIPACANEYLLQTVLRDDWGMDGVVFSDCDAVNNIFTTHNYTKDWSSTVAAAMHAGTDVNCGDTYQKYGEAALSSGVLSENDVSTAISRALGMLVRLGYFDPAENQPYRNIPPEAVNTPAAQMLALDAAREGFVLLKNSIGPGGKPTLPFATGNNPTIAIVGPMANATHTMQGNYYGQAPFLISPLAAFTALGYKVLTAPGCDVNGTDTTGFDAVLALAQQADMVLYLGGIDSSIEREGFDRENIDLPLIQQQLLQALAAGLSSSGGISSKPFAVGIFSGGPVDLSVPLDLPEVGAVLWVGYPGQAGGQAVASVVSGETSPAGRLPVTIYPAKYTSLVSMFDMSFRPSATNPGRTYRFIPDSQVVVPFGTGLSYTTFSYVWIPSPAVEEQAQVKKGDIGVRVEKLSIASLAAIHSTERTLSAYSSRVNVTNTGSVESDVVVLLFLLPSVPSPDQPIKQLVGYERISSLSPGETVQVVLGLQARQLAQVDESGHRWLRPGRVHLGLDVPTQVHHVLELEGEPTRLMQDS